MREHLPHVLHTKEGSRLTMHCLWHGTAKVRGGHSPGFRENNMFVCDTAGQKGDSKELERSSR